MEVAPVIPLLPKEVQTTVFPRRDPLKAYQAEVARKPGADVTLPPSSVGASAVDAAPKQLPSPPVIPTQEPGQAPPVVPLPPPARKSGGLRLIELMNLEPPKENPLQPAVGLTPGGGVAVPHVGGATLPPVAGGLPAPDSAPIHPEKGTVAATLDPGPLSPVELGSQPPPQRPNSTISASPQIARLAPIASRAGKPLTREEERILMRGDTFKECANCPEMVVIPPGNFTIGSSERDEEKPPRLVTIGWSFVVGKLEVTVAQYAACVAAAKCAPSKTENPYRNLSSNSTTSEALKKALQAMGMLEHGVPPTHPVVNVSWNDAKAFAAWLSATTKVPYRLLTEAEWEYAARANTVTRYAFGDMITKKQAKFSETGRGVDEQSVANFVGFTGLFPANDFGLHDMHGSVWEWCEDRFHRDYKSAPQDGSAWLAQGTTGRILRGGSWWDTADKVRSASRTWKVPDEFSGIVGFRVARTLNSAP